MSWDFSPKVINIFLDMEDLSWLYFLVSLLCWAPSPPSKKKLSWKYSGTEYQFKEQNVLFIEPVVCKFNPKWRRPSVIVSDISLVGVGPDGLSQHSPAGMRGVRFIVRSVFQRSHVLSDKRWPENIASMSCLITACLKSLSSSYTLGSTAKAPNLSLTFSDI